MIETITGMFLGGLIVLIIMTIQGDKKEAENKKLILSLTRELSLYKTWKNYYEYNYNQLTKNYNALKLSKNSYGKTEIPKGTIEAVKVAMKYSHPDNGGNSEDFIKFRHVYNVLIGKEKL